MPGGFLAPNGCGLLGGHGMQVIRAIINGQFSGAAQAHGCLASI